MHPPLVSDAPYPPAKGDAPPAARAVLLRCDARRVPAPHAFGDLPAWQAHAWIDAGCCAPVRYGSSLQTRLLEIRGVAARDLWRIRVVCAGASVFDLDAMCDRRGNWTSAGELLRDMARQFGQAGLTVDLGGSRPAPDTLTVQMLLRAGSDPTPALQPVALVQPGPPLSR